MPQRIASTEVSVAVGRLYCPPDKLIQSLPGGTGRPAEASAKGNADNESSTARRVFRPGGLFARRRGFGWAYRCRIGWGGPLTFAMVPSDSIDALVAVVLLAVAHLFVTQLRHVTGAARNALLMAGAGVSLINVLLYILPQLASKQDIMLASTNPGLLGVMEHHAYAMALIGLVVYFGIAQFSAGGAELRTTRSVLRYRAALIATVVAYVAYSVLVGYIMVHGLNVERIAMVLFTFAMATYFMISDYGLRRKWPDAFDQVIRWILAASVLVGWALGVTTEVSENVKVLWFSFLAGVVLIDTIREKLPREAGGSFWAFLAGVLGFGALVFATRLTA